jgi:hypothetical protein
MSEEEILKYIAKMKEYTANIPSTPPEKSLDSLVKAGICDSNKIIKEPYKVK